MHIKQIVIQGFKSYKDQTTTEPFSPKHNVVAIRFVLNDYFTNMTREERQALLHEGSGPATMSAFVEIVFDNADNRFPTGKEEVVLRRTIGLKKDEYSLDKKSATKTEVSNLLESAGFSSSNPYYIVPQGRITALCNSKDSDRLKLLKDVAGTEVYEVKRQESLKIMQETEAKQRKIEELLDFIHERLTQLEHEKEELVQFNDLDKERRCLEYTIYENELNGVNIELEQLEADRAKYIEDANQRREVLARLEQSITTRQEQLREIKQNIELVQIDRQQLAAERERDLQLLAQLELELQDIESANSAEKGTEQSLKAQLSRLEKEIERHTRDLADVRPNYEAFATEEQQLRDQYEEAERERTTIFNKQGRSAQFSTQAERDAWLRGEIQQLDSAHRSNAQLAKETKEELETDRHALQTVRDEMEALRSVLSHRSNEVNSQAAAHQQAKEERDRLTDEKKTLWREEARLESLLQNTREELKKNERTLSSTMDKGTSMGLQAIKRIAGRLRLSGVHGPLYELFDVDDKYRAAVETVAGTSLFHVVVDNDDVASTLLQHLNRERAGRVTFMPLNRLHPKSPAYPDSPNAIPMVRKIRGDDKFRPAFEQVFGKAIMCPSLDEAAEFARSHKLDALTLDGDRVDRKGAMSGGYLDRKRSRLECIRNVRRLAAAVADEEALLANVKRDLKLIEQRINESLTMLHQSEAKRRQLADQREQMRHDLTSKLADEELMHRVVQQKQSYLQDAERTVQELKQRKDALQAELATKMVNGLSRAEKTRLETVLLNIQKLQSQLLTASGRRAQLEAEKIGHETALNANLNRQRDELVARLAEVSGESQTRAAGSAQKGEVQQLQKRVDESHQQLQEQESQLESLRKREAAFEGELDREKNEQAETHRLLERQEKSMEKYLSRRRMLKDRREDCNRNIRELGVLPETVFQKYKNTNEKTLIRQLHRVNEQLKKFSHVNKKAVEQYNSFTKQQDQLEKRKDELDQSATSITELIAVLDQRKDEAIERTFKQVARNFTAVFEKLVPAGRGGLVIIRSTDKEQRNDDDEHSASDDDDDNQDEQAKTGVESYKGIALKVSFNSKADEALKMQQLSGGQKSVVALALIFAIQQCDPAPFYLFDEIDANLDAQYRTAVAAMVHELSANAQFITTTFRPELLAHADKFYGVTFQDKVSKIQCIGKEDAMSFVEQEQPH
ncbi:Structural maintenance of chromosomes protein 3 [Sorochytrium milnesiophthora]